ncbi:MAG: LysM peptidoglycan-binding domain-containing protein, partial [Anaerolineales bacterium]|nr:LysM peptidoglycan-binding domain-containing protein [Anaerolineales bacterium]
MRANRNRRPGFALAVLVCLAAALACARPDLASEFGVTPIGGGATPLPNAGGSAGGYAPGAGQARGATPAVPPRPTRNLALSPTPDPPRASALDRQTTESYTVQRNDTLNQIGARYGVTAEQIAAANGLQVADVLYVG